MVFRFPFFKFKKSAKPISKEPSPPPILKNVVPPQRSRAIGPERVTSTSSGKGTNGRPPIISKPETTRITPFPPTSKIARLSSPIIVPPDAPSSIPIPTSEILSLLPENILKPNAAETLPNEIALLTAEILPQLPRGRVQVSLDTLLSFFPPEAVDISVASSGNIKIKIPLHLIIPRLPASVISLSRDQVVQQIDSSIAAPFPEQQVPVTREVLLPQNLLKEEIAVTMAAPMETSFPPISPEVLSSPPFAVPKAQLISSVGNAFGQLIGITDGRRMRIQEVVEQIRTRFNFIAVLIVAKDGLLLAGSVSSGLDSNAWSSLGPQLFHKFGQEGTTYFFGEPQRCLLSVGNLWFSIFHDNGIYLIFAHRLEDFVPEFEERNRNLVREIAIYCRQQSAVASAAS